MGLINKILNKADKSQKKTEDIRVEKKELEKDLTIAEIKEKKHSKPVKKGKVASKVKNDDTGIAYKVLIKPLVTEKGTFLATENKYLFEVGLKANKKQIKKAIKATYNVDVTKVNIIPVKGKKVRYGKVKGKTKNRKKAIVTLKKGQTIEVYEGV
ncbi:50S ribosomal protein L23 [bacterium]|jgi:large subunit ribosomal protein L23|nr:50S ribosomal protein L23 [bacterium]MBT4335032.1 50S ribosomal protein L23 [bacterium]MBT4495260.1 50S ribosomal protein L23 [bacterium]MBT4763884.1 50S ribosomal protein L23 [bacterium]MBT5401255.1 50S ribosomal protein L23 [bacterium]